MTPPRRPPSGDRLPRLTDTDKDLIAVVAEESAEAAVQRVRERDLTGDTPMQSNPTPPPGVLWDAGAAAQHMRSCEAPDGPVGKLRLELKEQHEQREKAMRKTLVVVGLMLSAVTGGIQLWGRLSERSASAAVLDRQHSATISEMAQALQQVRGELTALRSAVKP